MVELNYEFQCKVLSYLPNDVIGTANYLALIITKFGLTNQEVLYIILDDLSNNNNIKFEFISMLISILFLFHGIESNETLFSSHQILFYSTQESRLFYSIPSKNRLFRFLEVFQFRTPTATLNTNR